MSFETRCPMTVSGDDDQVDARGHVIAREAFTPASEGPVADECTRGLQLAGTADAALDECVTLRALLDVTAGLIAVVEGPGHVFHFANSAWLKVIGGDVIGRTVQDVLPQAESQGLLAALDGIGAGTHDAGRNERHTIAIAPPGHGKPIHLEFVGRPMVGLQGVVLEAFDVTERVLADERQTLLMNELAHRVKNISATVIGLARLARGSATDLDTFLASLTDRIVAMCNTQDLLGVARTRPIQLRDLLALELAPYLDEAGGEDRVNMVCEDITLAAGSAVSLSMIVHELLTNALKYGALSAPGGRLRIRCTAAGPLALLTWSETTLHPIGPVDKRGFGSRLIERLARTLGGGVHVEPRPDGLHVVLSFAIETVAPLP